MKITRLLTAIVFMSICLAPDIYASTVTATSVMKSCSDKLRAGTPFSVDFVVSAENGVEISGDLSVNGRKFAYVTSGAKVIYDGHTQWTVDELTKEISIYEPLAAEVEQVNPFLILSGYAANYNMRLLGGSGNGVARVELVPKNSSDIQKVIVTINTTSSLPTGFEVYTSDGDVMRIAINNLKLNDNIPASRFVINTNNYSDYEVVDLR